MIEENKIIKKKVYYLDLFNISIILLLPLSLVTGPAIPDIIVSTSSLIFLISILIKKEFVFFKKKIFLFFLVFNLYLIFTSLISNNIYFSLHSTLFYFRFGIFSFTIFYLLKNYDYFLNYFTISLFLILTITCFDALFQYFYNYNTLGFDYTNNRLSGFFGEEKKLGSYLVKLLPLLFTILLFKNFYNKKTYMTLFYFLSLLVVTIVIFTVERTSIFIMFITIFGYLIFLKINKLYKLSLFSIIIFLSFFVILQDDVIKNRIINLSINQILGLNDDGGFFDDNEIQKEKLVFDNFRIFSTQHESHFINALKIFQDNKVFGIGPRLFRLECGLDKYYTIYGCSTHPHNYYVQLLAETGFIGFSFLLFVFIFISYNLIKLLVFKMYGIRYNNYYFSIMLLCFSLTWPIMTTGNFFNNWFNSIMYLCIGFLLFFYEKNLREIND